MTGQLSNSTTLKPGIIPLAQATDPAAAGHKAATLAALLGAGCRYPTGRRPGRCPCYQRCG